MRAQIISVAAVFFGLALASPAKSEDAVTISYQEPLLQVQMGYGSSSDNQKPGTALARSLRFDAFGQRFDINLEVNRTLLNAEQRALLGDRYQVYRGDIAGIPNSWVRLVIADEMPRGMLWDGTEFWAIEVARDPSTNADSAFMYRLGDLQIAPGALSCSEIGVTKNGGEFAKAIMSEISANAAQGPGATSQIDIAVIGDFEFTSDKGANTNAAMITRINNVDGIFSMQLGVQFNVGRIDTFASNNDPFTDQLDAGTLLEELSDYRNATPAQNANGLSHLFTGRDLDTTTVGIAWTEALCHRRFGASVTQATHSVTTDSLIAAHEFGHNFGAPHDGASGEACESETGDFLMATSINGSDQFSSCSITEMQDDVARARASCITPLPSTDVALVAGGQPGMVLLGDSATVSFDANSVGTDTANGVNVDVAVPTGVTVSSMSTTAGTCTSVAGGASCAIGTIAAGSGATVTLSTTASAVGSANFVATVTANTDENGNNNQATVQFDIDPAVDMISTAAATAQVALNGSTIIRPSVRNSSSITATDVTVTLTPGAGINIDSASWSPGTCSIANNVATCEASSLAVQSTNTLQIGITGTSEGSRSYSMSVSAAEPDRDGANNDVSGQITVGASSQGSDDSGGGAFGWLSLLFLMLIGARRSIA
jgi:hypothetical protein